MKRTLWHVTTKSNVDQILAGGFRDGPFRENARLKGVYFADQPTWDGMAIELSQLDGWVAIVVLIDEADAKKYHVVEEGGRERDWVEWFVPAAVANRGTLFVLTPNR